MREERGPFASLRFAAGAVCLLLAGLVLGSCGGGASGTSRDAGPAQTTLTVDASDTDGDTLQYQWRVNGGSVLNANARSTTWTLPDGPGLHFAYVLVSDGHGGYAQQQYAVSSDPLGTAAPAPAPRAYAASSVADFDGSTVRLRFKSAGQLMFTPAAGGAQAERYVYLPDVLVQVYAQGTSTLVYSGTTDVSGELDLPKLPSGAAYDVRCATSQSAPLAPMNACGGFSAGGTRTVIDLQPAVNDDRNLRLHGHVADADGATCGIQDEFFGLHSAATVQLQQADGTVLGAAVRVNRFGDYALDAPVPANGSLKLAVTCEGLQTTAAVPAPPAAGYTKDQLVELSVTLANHRPAIARMVGNGLDGNVRGAMVLPETGVQSNSLPGALQFLSYKATDTRLSGCMYYRALGAVAQCDAQGNPSGAITFDDWKRAMHFAPYAQGNTEYSATYINKMDLNLVRKMVATRVDATHIAFYVCNHPGPPTQGQGDVDAVLSVALANQKEVACVAMESTPSGGVNGGAPITKFFVFGPDGGLLTSVNLDGRGEKYVPGACVACHGGSVHDGRFPELGSPSPYLGANFLAFDTGNYLFGSDSHLTEAAQSEALYQLNQLVLATQPSPTNATSTLIQGWYASGSHVLDKGYVPQAWQQAASQPQASKFYREVVATSCRTCHASLVSPTYDWNATVLSPGRASTHFCGGTPELASNASMPNALISRDRLMQRAQGDVELQHMLQEFLGCTTPLPDPVFPRR